MTDATDALEDGGVLVAEEEPVKAEELLECESVSVLDETGEESTLGSVEYVRSAHGTLAWVSRVLLRDVVADVVWVSTWPMVAFVLMLNVERDCKLTVEDQVITEVLETYSTLG